MRYAIQIKRQAKRKLLSLPDKIRLRIVDAITQLGTDVDDPELDTKQLQASRLWRMRVGGWRIIYDRDDALRVISIQKIGPRGDVYK